MKYGYAMCSFSVQDRITGKPFSQRRSVQIAKVSSHVFENIIFLNQHYREKFYICAHIIYADGSTRAAAINAATVCLANSKVLMKGYATFICFGKYQDQLIIDLDGKQDKQGLSTQTV